VASPIRQQLADEFGLPEKGQQLAGLFRRLLNRQRIVDEIRHQLGDEL